MIQGKLIADAAPAVVSAIGGVTNLLSGGKIYRKQMRDLQKRKQQNESTFNKEYYADPTQLASNQAALTKANELFRRQTKNAQATDAVMGGNGKATAQAIESAANTTGNMMSRMAESNQARKERERTKYETRKDQLNAQINALREARKNNLAKAATETTKVAANSFINPVGLGGKKKTEDAPQSPETANGWTKDGEMWSQVGDEGELYLATSPNGENEGALIAGK